MLDCLKHVTCIRWCFFHQFSTISRRGIKCINRDITTWFDKLICPNRDISGNVSAHFNSWFYKIHFRYTCSVLIGCKLVEIAKPAKAGCGGSFGRVVSFFLVIFLICLDQGKVYNLSNVKFDNRRFIIYKYSWHFILLINVIKHFFFSVKLYNLMIFF